MIKKILVAVFLAAFALAMTNVSFASDTSALPANCIASTDGCNVCSRQDPTEQRRCTYRPCAATGNYYPPVCTAYADTGTQVACPAIYQPVCGNVQVQCFAAPCYPVEQTFGNRCEADRAHATNIQAGTCDSQSQDLTNTSRRLSSYNDTTVVGINNTLSFGTTNFSARVCNTKSGLYDTRGDTLYVANVISTLMACFEPTATYEAGFDLDGATYSVLGKVLTIDTTEGNRLQWTKVGPISLVTPTLLRRYGLIVRQLNQIMKARGYTTIDQKTAFIQSILNKLHTPNGVFYTRQMIIIRHFIEEALQFYLDHITDPTITGF